MNLHSNKTTCQSKLPVNQTLMTLLSFIIICQNSRDADVLCTFLNAGAVVLNCAVHISWAQSVQSVQSSHAALGLKRP